MSSKEKIIEYFISNSNYLISKGFNKKLIKENRWFTKIYYCFEKIAIEIEMDWRDLYVSFYVVKLIDGELPEDEYLNSYGEVCKVT